MRHVEVPWCLFSNLRNSDSYQGDRASPSYTRDIITEGKGHSATGLTNHFCVDIEDTHLHLFPHLEQASIVGNEHNSIGQTGD